jgi:hypothetical protein
MNQQFVLLLAIVAPVVHADGKPDASDEVPLFQDDTVVNVTIAGPIREIMETRSLEEELPGTLSYDDPVTGEQVSLEIKIRARGKFRRQQQTCSFPPLRLNFRKSNDTLFANADKLKLVTHCRNKSQVYEQSVYREYLVYRILNLLDDRSFRARLLQVSYFDTTERKEIDSAPAFLIEDDKQLAKRIGMKRDDATATSIASLDAPYTNLTSVFQYLIGNTDFSPVKGPPGEPCCHNYVLFKNDDMQISVPYDFDVTGFVDAPHAQPNPRFRLSSVEQRLYRGRCANNDQLEKTFQLFRDKKQDIYNLVNNQQGLRKSARKETIRYIDSFYDIIDSERQVRTRILESCLGR